MWKPPVPMKMPDKIFLVTVIWFCVFMWIFQQKSLNCVEHLFVCNLEFLEPKEIMRLPCAAHLSGEGKEGT